MKVKNKKGVILTLSAVLAAGVLIVFFIFMSGDKEENPAFSTALPSVSPTSSFSSPPAPPGSSSAGGFVYDYSPPAVEPVIPSSEASDIHSLYLSQSPRQPAEGESASVPGAGEEPASPSERISPADQEIFHRLFPAYYLDGLSYYQDLLINTGYFKSEDRLVFDNFDNVIEGLNRGLVYLLDTGSITQEQYYRFKTGINVDFKNLVEYEWSQLKNENGPYDLNRIKQGTFNIKDFWPPTLLAMSAKVSLEEAKKEDNLFKKAWGAITGFFSGETAFAGSGCKPFAFPGVAVCIEGVECYRSGPPLPAGTNLWAPCCCCCKGKTPIGCLNAVCRSPHAAIWDPMTGICGCG